MLTIRLLREKPSFVKERLLARNFKEVDLVDTILERDEERRRLQTESDQLLSQQKELSREIGGFMKSGEREKAEEVKEEVAKLKEEINVMLQRGGELQEELKELLLQLPNLPYSLVKEGNGSDDNEIVKEGKGVVPTIDEPLPHWELAKKYNLIDFDLGVKVTGAGFPIYRGKGAALQRALISYFLDYNMERGYEEFIPPLVVNETSAYGTGQLPDKEGQMYHVGGDNLYLIPTAEVPLTNIYRDLILQSEELPQMITGYTPCFRREAGSYGKDVRGLNRLHQFDKVEIVQVAHPDNSYSILDEMVEHVEGIVRSLGLPYRILRLCGGDLGFASAMTYDFEVWSAAQGRWLEVSSVSNFESYQANRLMLRYRDEEGRPQLAHTLNGSALALPRIVAALIENYQQEDKILIPQPLQHYTRFSAIELK